MEISKDYPIDTMAESELFSNTAFLAWLHEVTQLGYNQDFIMGTVHLPIIERLFTEGKPPEEAIKIVIENDQTVLVKKPKPFNPGGFSTLEEE